MNEIEWLTCAKVLARFYPHNFKMDDEIGMELWFEMLADLPGPAVIEAVKHMVKTQRAFPSVADIRTLAEPRKREPVEAWAEALKAAADGGCPEHQRYVPHGSPREGFTVEHQWSEPAVKAAVEACGGLRAFKVCPVEQQGVLRAQFLKAYQAFQGAAQRDEALPALLAPQLPALPGVTRIVEVLPRAT